MVPHFAGTPQPPPHSTLRSWLVGALLTCVLTVGALIVIRLVQPAALDGVLASSSTGEARRAKTAIDIRWIQAALFVYAHEHAGAYPAELGVLVEPGPTGKRYLGELREVPLDPWKRPYRYEPPTAEHPRPRLTSLGADGLAGGEGEDADIDSDKLPPDR